MKIIELYEEELPQTHDEIIDIIKRDCQPFLKELGVNLLYRGIRQKIIGPSKQFSKKIVRLDRKPKNTNERIHKETDDWFNSKFGFRARSSSVFAVGKFRFAKGYGEVFAIFPIGDFSFVWSENVEDLFLTVPDTASESRVKSILDDAGYKTTDLQAAIRSTNEIMIYCKEYYAVRIRDDNDVVNFLDDLA